MMLRTLSRRLPPSNLLPLLPLLHHYLHPNPNSNPNLIIPKPKTFSSQSQPSSTARESSSSSSSSSSHGVLCPGCGVHMQSSSPSLPGFFLPPVPKPPDYRAPLDRSNPIPLSSLPLSLKLGTDIARAGASPQPPPAPVPLPLVCARCHSLRHYGRVKDPSAEHLLPDFDFDRAVAPKILSPSGPRSLLLLLVDAADFDGSFPKKLSKLLSVAIDSNSAAWKEGRPANVPRVLLVVTKVDVLPPSLSPQRMEEWARRRTHECGWSARLAGVHLVSAVRGWGVRNLVEKVQELAGSRGNVWAVGAQNAGKSTLINAMGRCNGGSSAERKSSQLTEAPVPGTTLGVVRVAGVLAGQAKLFDTPGILHPYQISTRLTREEQKLVHVGKELRPRTYRIKAGYSVHLGGLLRVDVESSSAETIYLTVWASSLLPLHMGRTVSAFKIMEEHIGRHLQPPASEERVAELGKWTRREFSVTGNTWDANTIDIAVAGLGWVAIGLKGEAVIGVWTYDEVDVVSRSSLVPERAQIFEEPGFTASKLVSRADSKYNKLKHEKEKKKRHDDKVKLPDTSSVMSVADANVS